MAGKSDMFVVCEDCMTIFCNEDALLQHYLDIDSRCIGNSLQIFSSFEEAKEFQSWKLSFS